MDRDYTYRILGCIYEVYNQLGPGLLESIYEAAMMKIFELKSVVDYRKLFEKQLFTYLRLMNCEMGYVVNFNTDNIRAGIHPVVNTRYKKNPKIPKSLE